MITRRELVLAALAANGGPQFTPVQVQKLFFLVDEDVSDLVNGPHFSFKPNDYGPYDKNVYRQIELLALEGLVQISVNPTTRFKTFKLTHDGRVEGQAILEKMDSKVADYLNRLSKWVRSMSFKELVLAIYAKHPKMKDRSLLAGEGVL